MKDTKEFIKKTITYWFDSQLSMGCSPEEAVIIAKVCVLLDVAHVFLGYDDNKMASKDDKIRDACYDFLDKLKEV